MSNSINPTSQPVLEASNAVDNQSAVPMFSRVPAAPSNSCSKRRIVANVALTISLFAGALILGFTLFSHYGLIAKVGTLSKIVPAFAKGFHISSKAVEYTGMALASAGIIGSGVGLYFSNRKKKPKPPGDPIPESGPQFQSHFSGNNPNNTNPPSGQPSNSSSLSLVEPESSKPDNSEPDNSKPDNSKPNNSEPDNSEPNNSEPDNSEPANAT